MNFLIVISIPGNKDSKKIKYNRLRGFEKSESSHFPAKSGSRTSFNCLPKSASSYDGNGNTAAEAGSGGGGGLKDPISWNSKYTLDNSDSEYEDNNEEDEYRMSTTPDDDFSDFGKSFVSSLWSEFIPNW